MEYSTEQRVFIVEQFHRLNSYVLVQRAFQKRFKFRYTPSKPTISRLVQKFRQTGQVTNQHKGNSGRKHSKCTPENVERVQAALAQSPKKSLRRASQQLGLSKDTIHRILRNFLKLYPYKIQIDQPLKGSDKLRRLEFAREFSAFLKDNPAVLNSIWFSDEAHFHLCGYVNKQNMRFWAAEQPSQTVSRALHPQKTTVWCAISATGIYGPIFIHDTINAERYRDQLLGVFIDFMKSSDDVEIDSAYFQQDGARPHTANLTLDMIHDEFSDRVLSNRYPERFGEGHHWPPYSPDLNPCDFFLWGYLKDRVYQNNPHTVEELEAAIREEVLRIDESTMDLVVANFARRLDVVVEKGDGGHFENVFVR